MMSRFVIVRVNERGRRIGESHHKAMLSDHEVELMRAMREDGLSFDTLAKIFECAKSTVADICHGRIRNQRPAEVRRVPAGDV
jgi:ribosome-binding protein aMBF1 (putative translation factor)